MNWSREPTTFNTKFVQVSKLKDIFSILFLKDKQQQMKVLLKSSQLNGYTLQFNPEARSPRLMLSTLAVEALKDLRMNL